MVHLSAHFQGFCRDLYTEAADHLSAGVDGDDLRSLVRQSFADGMALRTANATRSALQKDFRRLGVSWRDVLEHDHDNDRNLQVLELINQWRNAVAHQDFVGKALDLGGGRTQLLDQDLTVWKLACDQLALSLDSVVGDALHATTGRTAW